jgi:hypothetical protein
VDRQEARRPGVRHRWQFRQRFLLFDICRRRSIELTGDARRCRSGVEQHIPDWTLAMALSEGDPEQIIEPPGHEHRIRTIVLLGTLQIFLIYRCFVPWAGNVDDDRAIRSLESTEQPVAKENATHSGSPGLECKITTVDNVCNDNGIFGVTLRRTVITLLLIQLKLR